MKQVEKSNSILTSIFDNFDILKVKSGAEPLEAVLAKEIVKAAEQLDGDAVGDPLMVANLQFELGWVIRVLGYENEAIPLFVKARDTFISILGEGHRKTIACTGRLAICYLKVGKLRTALLMQENNYLLAQRSLGAVDIDTFHTALSLARCYRYDNQIDRALPLIEDTMNLAKKNGIDKHVILDIADEMISCYHSSGKRELAQILMVENLRLSKEILGPTHHDTLISMNGLAVSYLFAQKLDLALPLLEETLKLQETTLGSNHPDTLKSIGNLAGGYWQAKQLERSIPLFEKALKLQEIKLGRQHLDTAGTVANLGVNYKDAGRLSDAIPLLEEGYRAAKKHPMLRWVGSELLDAYTRAGKSAEAGRLVVELLADIREKLTKDSPQLAGQLALFGLSLLQAKAFTEAEPLLRECLSIREKKEPDDWRTFNTQSMLGGALLGQKKFADAEPLLLKGYEGMKQREKLIPPQAAIRIHEAVDRMIALYTALEKPDEVKTWTAVKAELPKTESAKPPEKK